MDDARRLVAGPDAPTRRQFLKTASRSLGGAALAASAAPLVGRAARSEPDPLGVALVGLGNYATGQLAPALQETTKCELTGIVTGTPAKAETWKQKYDLPDENVYDYETYDRIADNDAIDIVYVVLPNAMHAEYTIRAAEAGKHVICEKPMATSAQACRDMIAACERAGVKLSIGYRLHFEPHHQRAMTLGQDEVFGPVTVMQNGFGFRISDDATDQPHIEWRLDKEMAGGGALMDVGIYAIQAARYVTGEEPVAVTAREYKTRPEVFSEVDETIVFQLECPGGTVVDGSTSYNGNFNRLYATAPDGWFEVRPSYGYGGIEGRTHEGPMGLENVTQQARQMDAFAECIRQDRPSRVGGEEGLRDLEVIEAIYASIDAGGGRVEV
ncbi:MAG: Gfo/Idh/MocA family protein [Salinibacter sp.]